MVRNLAKAAKKQGSYPELWYVSFDPVPRSAWAAVEVWDGRVWIPVPLDQPERRIA